jgi:hypothetical protein
MSNLARLLIDKDLVLQWLDIGEMNIVNSSYDNVNGTLTLILDSPEFIEVTTSGYIPLFRPQYTKETDSMGRFIVKRVKVDSNKKEDI